MIYSLKKPITIDLAQLSTILDEVDKHLLTIREQLQTISTDTTKYLDNIQQTDFPDIEISRDSPGIVFSSVCTMKSDILIQRIDLFQQEVIQQL